MKKLGFMVVGLVWATFVFAGFSPTIVQSGAPLAAGDAYYHIDSTGSHPVYGTSYTFFQGANCTQKFLSGRLGFLAEPGYHLNGGQTYRVSAAVLANILKILNKYHGGTITAQVRSIEVSPVFSYYQSIFSQPLCYSESCTSSACVTQDPIKHVSFRSA